MSTEISCRHSISCMNHMNLNLENCIPVYYRKEAYAIVYEQMIYLANRPNTEYSDIILPFIKKKPIVMAPQEYSLFSLLVTYFLDESLGYYLYLLYCAANNSTIRTRWESHRKGRRLQSPSTGTQSHNKHIFIFNLFLNFQTTLNSMLIECHISQL